MLAPAAVAIAAKGVAQASARLKSMLAPLTAAAQTSCLVAICALDGAVSLMVSDHNVLHPKLQHNQAGEPNIRRAQGSRRINTARRLRRMAPVV
jgi:hypothetical protein